MPTSNRFTRGMKRLGALLGIRYPEDNPDQNQKQDIQLTLHTPTEMRYLPGIYSPDGNKTETLPSTGAFLDQLLTTSQQAGNWSRTAQSLNVLAPEIRDASEIYISSIISPTDLQTQSIQVLLEGTDLGPELETKISTVLTDFFNNDFELAARMKEWLHMAMFVDGASPILIVPQVNVDTLNQAVDLDETKMGHDVKEIIKNANNPGKLSPQAIPGNYTMGSERYTETVPPVHYDPKNSSMELLLPSDYATTSNIRMKSHYERLTAKIDQDIDAAFETLSNRPGYEAFKTNEVITTTREAKKAIRDLLSDAEKSSFVISNDISLINRGDKYKDATKKLEQKVAEHFLMDTNNPLYLLDTEESLESKHHPAVVRVPYQAVIPVIMPGTPDKQLGFYILVDQWGTPITNHVYDRSTVNGPRKLTEGAMQATFGQPGAYKYAAGINDDQRFEATLMMFGLTMRNLLMDKLDEYGFHGATVEEHEATTLCMFRYLLAKKKVGLVFVPSSLLTYIAFDYHQDGTGKSKIEDLSTLLSLRTVLVISGVMAATENAIDHKVLEVDVDEKNANVMQYLSMVRDAFIEKRMLRFDNEPLTVQRDLIQRSLTVLPKNMKGIRENLSTNLDHKSSNVIAPDQGFMELLANWLITGLDVPHAAMNQTSEAEYSRSVATTNIVFNNKIKGSQKVVVKFGNKFVRTYIKYSQPLQAKILEILKDADNSRKDTHHSSESTEADGSDIFDELEETEPLKKGQKSKQEVKMNKDNINKKLLTVVQNVRITLPAPQIVVDKAQYEEITSYMDAIDRVLAVIFSENQIVDQDAKEMFTLFRETVKADMVRDYIKQIGFQSSFNIPYPKDIDIKNAKDLYLYISNQKLSFDNFKKYVIDIARKHLEEGGDTDTGMDMNEGGEEPMTEEDTFGDMGGTEPTGETTPEEGGETPQEEEPQEPQEEPTEEEQQPEDINFDETPPPPSF